MANEIRDLPLFPLGTVLFPGMQLPLQLFEPRYLQMFQDIARQDSRFGVVLIKEGVEVGEPAVPFDIGTIARVTQHENNPDGRIILMSVGQQRFRSLEVLQQRPYMTARVEILPPDPAGSTEVGPKIKEMFLEYARLVAGMANEWVRDVPFPDAPSDLAYLVARNLDVNMSVKQGLLEMDTAEECLRAEVEILEMITEHLRSRVRREGPSQHFSAN